MAHSVPTQLQWVFSAVKFSPTLKQVEAQCQAGSIAIEAVSDGSFKNAHGTASWMLCWGSSEKEFIQGSMVCPGSTEIQSAYRSELAGLYGICCVLWALRQRFQCDISAIIGCDGLSAIRSCDLDHDLINVNQDHFDLISACRHLLRQAKIKVLWKHIKGHQDDQADAVLDRWALRNIEMDTLAKDWWRQTRDMPFEDRPFAIFGEVGSIWLNNAKESSHKFHLACELSF